MISDTPDVILLLNERVAFFSFVFLCLHFISIVRHKTSILLRRHDSYSGIYPCDDKFVLILFFATNYMLAPKISDLRADACYL